ncbi:MAG: hypothetical protein ABI787_05160 [Spartobacteria bacterium]
MKKLHCALALLLVTSILCSGCSMLTTQGRQERAYSRYVKKSSAGRVKQQKRMRPKKTAIPESEPSEPMIASGVSGPESVSSGE